MSEPRNYIRATAGGFNATTVDTAVYTQLRTVWTTTTNTLVGVFSPLSLGRTAGNPATSPSVPSYARVMLSGVVAPGDQVRVLNSAGVVRYAVDASVVGTEWLYLAPDDSIAIASAGATSAEILVIDFSEDNAATLILAQVTQANGSSTSGGIAPQSSQNIAATGTIDSFNGDLVVFVNAAAPATLTLPALGTVALGSTVTVIRTGGAGLPTIVTDIPADQVNGSATVPYKAYPLRSANDEVKYIRVPSGWARPQGTPAPAVIVDGANPTNLSALSFAEGSAYVEVQSAVLGAFIDLPFLASVRVGSRIVILNNSVVARTIQGQLGENVNGVAQVTLPAGLTAIVESAGTQWYATVSA